MVDLDKDDPWAWTRETKQATPLSANIASSQEQAPPPMQLQGDPVTQQIQGLLINKGVNEGIDATSKGVSAAYKAYGAPLAASSSPASQAILGAPAPAMSLAPAVVNPTTAALTEAGITGLAAPMASTAATGAGILGTEAALGGALASTVPAAATTGAATAGLGAAGVAGGEAALAAMGPVGWAIGAGLLAKRLGIF